MSDDAPVPATRAIAAWQQQLHEDLRPLLPAGTTVAMLDAPTTSNWGDVAIWLGQRRVLARLDQVVAGELDDRGFDHERVRRLVGDDGVVVLPGGGAFGDLYRDRMQHREQVLTSLRGTKVIQLSQSIHFERAENLERTKRLIGAHGDVHLFLRDEPSLELARREFDCPSALAPDLAFGLGPLEAPHPPSTDILWIRRRGKEAPDWDHWPDPPPGTVRSDWKPAAGHRLANAADLAVPAIHKRLYLAGTTLGEPLRRRLLPSVPRHRMRLALRFLSQGRVVVTDRLHGHILAMLVGKPSVLLDNRIGKLRAFHDTWTSGVEGVHLASDPAEALELALELAAHR